MLHFRYLIVASLAAILSMPVAISCSTQARPATPETTGKGFISLRSGKLVYKDGTEARLYGVNFQTPLSWEYNRLAGVGVAKTREDLHKVADNNLDDLQMLGINFLRCHLTPCDLTDAEGNLDESSVFLDALDYLIAGAQKRGMYISFAFLNHMGQRGAGSAWIGKDRGTWIQDESVVKCERTYIQGLINHVNRYNNTALKDTENIAYWELINEPDMFSYNSVKSQPCVSAYAAFLNENGLGDSPESYERYRQETVRDYINGMKDLLRRNGDKHLVCWGLNWHRYRRGNADIFRGVSESDADIVAFCNYPGQDNAGQNYWNKSQNFTDNDFSSWFKEQLSDENGYGWLLTPSFGSKAVVVYEFETFFNQSAYLYPLQATYFRALRAQAASMWTYTFNEIAPYAGGSHFLNLRCTPAKMVSFLVARQIFGQLPYLCAFPADPNEQSGEHYVISKSHNGAIYSDSEKYINSCPVDESWNPIPASPEVKYVAGYGSSPLVSYPGTGAYFIKDESGELIIDIMPDVRVLGDIYSSSTNMGQKIVLDYNVMHPMSIKLSAWENTPSALYKISDGVRELCGYVSGATGLRLSPGKYSLVPTGADKWPDNKSFVCVSQSNPKYFCLSNGKSYIPIGCNLAAMSSVPLMEHYMEELHRNGGNFARVWLNSDFFEIEKKYGEWDTAAISHIDRLLELADRYGIKIKMCIESFRKILPGRNRWDTKASYHVSNGGPFENMMDYISSGKGKEEYLKRLTFLQERYGDNPAIFGWELWNEMNAVEADDIRQWNVEMLDSVHEMFPKNMVMQSLGSLDREWSFDIYEYFSKLPSNDIAQVHRYYDDGAELPQCQAPLDLLSRDAVNHLLSYGLEKPVILAECGAVMASHSGPHEFYAKDSEGIILHDFLFAPFFCGAAGPGHLWHWDHYIDKVDVWFQIGRFSTAVEGIDPIAEDFKPVFANNDGLRTYTLDGRQHIMSWCRDSESSWKTELSDGIPPREISGMAVDMTDVVNGRSVSSVEVYDPWQDKWYELAPDPNVLLAPFKRSVVIKITLSSL